MFQVKEHKKMQLEYQENACFKNIQTKNTFLYSTIGETEDSVTIGSSIFIVFLSFKGLMIGIDTASQEVNDLCPKISCPDMPMEYITNI